MPEFPTYQSQSVGFEGVINARELGGYVCLDGRKIKHGTLLRGGDLNAATDTDIYRLENEFHITKIFDFRTEMEVSHAPDRQVEGADLLWLPAIDPETEKIGDATLPRDAYADLPSFLLKYASQARFQEIARNFYPEMVRNEYTQLQYAAFLQMLVRDDTVSVYWHCSQGKDRTGFGAAYLLLSLGADRDLVIRDYDLSNVCYRKAVEDIYSRMDLKGMSDAAKEVALTFIGANTDYFINALDIIESEYGSTDDYIRNILCLSDDDRQKLCDKYLE